tara:strand:+ start:1339 stop:2127 length:789 start_codon:yes stop_codon:yes gene_type:complete
MPPRRSIRCGHCKEEGHNIGSCDLFKIEFNIALISQDPIIPIHTYRLNKVNLHKLTEFKSLYEGHIPYVVHSDYLIRYVQNDDTFDHFANFIIEKKEKNEIKEYKKNQTHNINIESNYYNNFRRRFNYLKANCLYYGSINLMDMINIVNNDHIEVTTRLNDIQVERRERWRREEEEHRLQYIDQVEVQTNIMNREILPVLRETIVETDDCPICLDSLGETNKTILRCGHPLCTPCLLTQTLRGAANNNTQTCICSVCRTPYL